jgi:hypothetical protein
VTVDTTDATPPPHAADDAPVTTPQPPTDTGRQARDVMTFGREFGRCLSDARIVGRAESFAKVSASSRVVKRAVGLTARGVLEDIALDADIDAHGRLGRRHERAAHRRQPAVERHDRAASPGYPARVRVRPPRGVPQ